MSTVRKMTPTTGKEIGVRRATRPFTHSMEEFFENFLPRRWMETFMEPMGWRRPMWTDFERELGPVLELDLIDRENHLLVRAELPGVNKEDVEVTVAGDYLTIEAKREFKEEKEEKAFYRRELGYGKLQRTVYLPLEVDAGKVKAELKDGILEVTLPKVRAVKRHTVKVA